jgi:hypothetical protein
MTLVEIETTFKEIFREDEGIVKTVDTVYEKDSSNGYKLVISIHGLSVEDTIIIHTKFIFRVDETKSKITENSFTYLYDINCGYHVVEFNNIIDMKNKIGKIIDSNDFGEDLQLLSDFIEAPATFLNHYLRQSKITDYSIFSVIYEPKFKIVPCQELTFDFNININDNYTISLIIKKTDRTEAEDIDKYSIRMKLLDTTINEDVDTLLNLHSTIGSAIARIIDKKLNQ